MPETKPEIITMILNYRTPSDVSIYDIARTGNPYAVAAIQAASQGNIRDTNVCAYHALRAYGEDTMLFIDYQMACMGAGATIIM